MSALEIYRQNAAAEREAALTTALPKRQAMHERSAEIWDEMARAVEDTAQRAQINASAKQDATYNGQRKSDRDRLKTK